MIHLYWLITCIATGIIANYYGEGKHKREWVRKKIEAEKRLPRAGK